jgi:hypothetical protein
MDFGIFITVPTTVGAYTQGIVCALQKKFTFKFNYLHFSNHTHILKPGLQKWVGDY